MLNSYSTLSAFVRQNTSLQRVKRPDRGRARDRRIHIMRVACLLERLAGWRSRTTQGTPDPATRRARLLCTGRRYTFLIARLGAVAMLPNPSPAVAEIPFTLTSSDVSANQPGPLSLVFDQEGCTGGNRSPQLSWHGAPAATRSFAITIFDPDAPGR